MIKSFSDKNLEKLFYEENFKNSKYSKELTRAALKRLFVLDAAEQLKDLANSPGNRLEKLYGDLKEYYSLRVNKQWRIIFRWKNNDVYDVKLVDYH